jgi:hypothetical protein
MIQPGILVIGRQIFIKIDQIPITFDQIQTLPSAIATVIAYCYILNVEYCEPLKFVYAFFEFLSGFDKTSVNSIAVKTLLSKIGFPM